MKCPKCKKEMEEGFLKIFGYGGFNRNYWTKEDTWIYLGKFREYAQPKKDKALRGPDCRLVIYNY